MVLFLAQLALNALWSWIFFKWHRGGLAVFDIAALWICLVATVYTFLRVRVLAATLLVPYLVWVTFASALTVAVWRLNPSAL